MLESLLLLLISWFYYTIISNNRHKTCLCASKLRKNRIEIQRNYWRFPVHGTVILNHNQTSASQ